MREKEKRKRRKREEKEETDRENELSVRPWRTYSVLPTDKLSVGKTLTNSFFLFYFFI